MTLPADFRKIDDEFGVSGQVTADQVAAIADAGYKSIICNRPDAEVEAPYAFAEIQAAAEAAGLKMVYIPVSGAGMTQDDVDATKVALEELEKPIYAYCRSGARSTNVYGMAKR